MHHHGKWLTTALGVVLALAFLTSTATANRSISVEGGARSVSAAGQLKFGESRLDVTKEITCDVTLLRTIGASIAKTSGTLFGKVTGVAIDRGGNLSEHCRKGSNVQGVGQITPLPGVHRELGSGVLLWDVSGANPELWKLIYDSFQGTLPSISGINFHIEHTQFEFREFLVGGVSFSCLWEGPAYGLIEISAGAARTARAVLERTELRRISGSILCPSPARFEGTFSITPTINIRLV